MPQATPSFTSTMELDFTQPTTRQASSASAHSASVGWRLVTTRQSARGGGEVVGVLHQQPAGELADLVGVGRRAARPSSSRVFLRLAVERLDHAGAVAGGDHDVGLGGGHHALDGGVVDRVRQGHDAAEGRALVALEGPLVGLGQGVGHRRAARVGVLDDGDGRLGRGGGEVVGEPPGGVGVEEVEVAAAPCRRAARRRPTTSVVPISR